LNQWNACATVSRSADAASTPVASAAPRRYSTARRGRRVRELSVARLDADHAFEVRAERDGRLPVPVPTSTASRAPAPAPPASARARAGRPVETARSPPLQRNRSLNRHRPCDARAAVRSQGMKRNAPPRLLSCERGKKTETRAGLADDTVAPPRNFTLSLDERLRPYAQGVPGTCAGGGASRISRRS
jgi:hypothetical protein